MERIKNFFWKYHRDEIIYGQHSRHRELNTENVGLLISIINFIVLITYIIIK